jgi:hypothetical protein
MALPRLERAVGLCQDADLPNLFVRMAAPLGAAYTLAGGVADAVPLLIQAMAQATAMERLDVQNVCRLPLGEAHLLAGHLEKAQPLAEQALMFAPSTRNVVIRRMPCGFSATSRRGAITRRASPPKPTTTKPSIWPRS